MIGPSRSGPGMRSRASGAACLDASFGASADALRRGGRSVPLCFWRTEQSGTRHRLWPAAPDRAGARPYHRTCSAGSPIIATASPSQIVNPGLRRAPLSIGTLLSKKRSKKELTKRPPLVCIGEMIGPTVSSPAPVGMRSLCVRRGTARRFFLPLCIRALALSGLRLLFASFDVSNLCTFLWTCDAGRAGAHPYSIVQSNHQTQGGFFAATLSMRPRSGSNPRLLC